MPFLRHYTCGLTLLSEDWSENVVLENLRDEQQNLLGVQENSKASPTTVVGVASSYQHTVFLSGGVEMQGVNYEKLHTWYTIMHGTTMIMYKHPSFLLL